VELLPVHTFVNDSFLLEKGLTNYWGYNSIAFFAPARRYAREPTYAAREFKEMVARLHDAGLEVILDVVYNHTAEGNERGPMLSFKGIDNASYYRLIADQPRYYVNDTGTGNTLNLSHPRVLQMVTDSLRYWAARCGWMASASTSRQSSAARTTASTRAAASSTAAGRTRCCRA
jgi:glycogen operon protein